MSGSNQLPHDPYNLIIAGVGGQGNILMSKVLGEVLMNQGLTVTIGESFGMAQRGGAICSHLRISKDKAYSPMVPPKAAHLIVGLEPAETFRLLSQYGNPEVKVVCNIRPIHPISVISGDASYPEIDDICGWIKELSAENWLMDATEEAMKLGRAVYTNIILIGALAGINVLPIDRDVFETVIKDNVPEDKVEMNMKAFDVGRAMVS